MPTRFVPSILHPTDFSDASDAAFVHALGISLLEDSELTILNVSSGSGGQEWTRFPSVRRTLEQWGLLEVGSKRTDVAEKLGLGIDKVSATGRNVVEAVLGYLDRRSMDLIVLATRGSEGLPRWIRPAVSEPIARRSKTMTLFVPEGCRGFVSRNNGALAIDRILVPVDHDPSPELALQATVDAIGASSAPQTRVTLLHCADTKRFPSIDTPSVDGASWEEVTVTGNPVDEILEAAEQNDLIVMSTAGREGFLDALRGTTTERVVRGAACPVLAVPIP